MSKEPKKDDPNPYDTAFKEFADQDPELLLLLVGGAPTRREGQSVAARGLDFGIAA